MRFRIQSIIAVLWLSLSAAAHAQGFVNFDFEAANVSAYGSGPAFVPITNALPGWNGYIGASQVGQVFYNTVSLGSAAISLQSLASSFLPIQGSYSVILQSSPGSPANTSAVGQVGQIPSTSMSLLFLGAGIQVTFNGQPLSLIPVNSSPNYSGLGADVSMFAGQTGELKFLMPNFAFGAMSYLDDIRFSDQAIPEPSPLGLLGLGILLFGWRLREKSKCET